MFHSVIDELAPAAIPWHFVWKFWATKALFPGTGQQGIPHDVNRMKHVLQHVAEKAELGQESYPRGQGQGIAFHFSHLGYIAQVAEVTASKDGKLKVDRVVV